MTFADLKEMHEAIG